MAYNTKPQHRQAGYGILAVLMGAAVLAAVLSVSLLGDTGVTRMLAGNNAAQQAVAQASLIRARLLQCSNDYPTGNNGGAYRLSFPRADTATLASALTCPGNALNLWNWSDGVAMPSAMTGFGSWYYTNDATSMRLTLTSTVSDRASLVPTVVSLLGAQASQSGTSPTITLSWVLAN